MQRANLLYDIIFVLFNKKYRRIPPSERKYTSILSHNKILIRIFYLPLSWQSWQKRVQDRTQSCTHIR